MARTPTGQGAVDWEAVGRHAETFPDPGRRDSVSGRFRHVAAIHNDSLAISSPAGTWTYGELLDQAIRKASALRTEVAGTAEPIAVLAAHDGPLVVTILSIILSGHIVVLLDPMSPTQASAETLREARPRILLHDADLAETADGLAHEVGLNTRRIDDLDAEPVELPARTLADPLMLAFTSGTSGTPKGAIITHGVLMNLVRGATNALAIGPDDRIPMLFPTSLAVAAYPLFLPLLNGGTLATLDVRSVGLAPIAQFLHDERITLAYLAPTVVRFLVDTLAGHEFPDLRLIALGGEMVDREVVELAARLFGAPYLANGYGTTETGVIALHVFEPGDAPEPVPTGQAVADIEILVLDDHGEVRPPGEPGEIAVASPYLFEGYWGHPELNRAVLSEDPNRRPGWRLYRTGDFGHIDRLGALVVSGRLDTKVKVRGRFVVLGDVEAAINALDEVTTAAVTSCTVDGNAELIAYVVAAGPDIDTAQLRAALLERHDAFWVPSRWVVIDELPRLPNGKVDRRSLPAPEVIHGNRAGTDTWRVSAASAGDRAGIRLRVRDIWEALLPVGVIGPDENFFHLGGDSLLAAQMLVEVERQLGVVVPMGELVAANTVRTLSEAIHRIGAGAAKATTVACVQRGDAERPRLWFVHDLHGSAFRVRHLAAALGADQPVWSFESPLLAGWRNRNTGLDTFAARYVTDLLEAQPEGPYLLAGYSFGGICAYEMARQIERSGREVAFVGVVDVGPGYRGTAWRADRSPRRPWFGIAPPPRADATIAEQVGYYRDMASNPARLARHLMMRSGLSRLVDPLRFGSDLRRTGRVRPEWRLWYAWEEHWKLAATAWNRRATYPGAIDLFWADETGSADSTMGWAPLVGSVSVHRFPGHHHGVLEADGATHLAAAMRPVMGESETGPDAARREPAQGESTDGATSTST